MVGGVLLEKSVGAIVPDLTSMVSAVGVFIQFQAACSKLDQGLDKNKQEMNAIETKYADVLKPSTQEDSQATPQASKAGGGVLV